MTNNKIQMTKEIQSTKFNNAKRGQAAFSEKNSLFTKKQPVPVLYAGVDLCMDPLQNDKTSC
jgi:hypothetical protein